MYGIANVKHNFFPLRHQTRGIPLLTTWQGAPGVMGHRYREYADRGDALPREFHACADRARAAEAVANFFKAVSNRNP